MHSVVFHVDGLRYRWFVDEANRVSFCLEDDNDRLNLIPLWDRPGDWDWDRKVRVWGSSGLCRNPIKVWRAAANVTLDWLRRAKPAYWSFVANDARKGAVYRRLADRMIGMIDGYKYHSYDNGFYFYRVAT